MIITSLLDTDTYKLSMLYFIWKNTPNARVKYRFVCRNNGIKLGFLERKIRQELLSFINLRFTDDDIKYLKGLRYLSNNYTDYSFFDYLKTYQTAYCNDAISVWNDNGELNIEIQGLWTDTILYEVPILAIVNELYFRQLAAKSPEIPWKDQGLLLLDHEADLVNTCPDFVFSEFGTRRRFSKEWQEIALCRLREKLTKGRGHLVGTSNLYLARK